MPPAQRIIISRKLSSFPNNQAHQEEGSTTRPADILLWNKEQVTSWLLSVQPVTEVTQRKWEKLEVDGRSLGGVTPDLLMKECGVPFGTAFPIVAQIQKLIGSGQATMQPAMPYLPGVSRPISLGAKYLSDLILNHIEFKRHLKKDPGVPVKLAINDANFKRVGRDDALCMTVAAFILRLYERKRGTGHDRQWNPMAATLATTGAGKSFYLDELAALRPEDLDMIFGDLSAMEQILLTMPNSTGVVKDLPQVMQEMKEILQNTVAVTITYNGESNWTSSVDDDNNTSLGLALRALHSYYIGPMTQGGLGFSTFVSVMKDQLGPLLGDLTLPLAVKCIAEHSKKGVLLLADELMKAEATVLNVVKQIGVCLDECSPSQFNTTITTLNMAIGVGEHLSGHDFLWVPLLPAKYSDAVKLFQHVIVEERQKSFSPKALRAIAALEQCIADCNGHFRSLEKLWRLWHQFKHTEPTYSWLISQLAIAIDSKNGGLKLPHICAALRGEPVLYNDKVPGLQDTYGECIANGIFLNTIGTSKVKTNASSTEPETTGKMPIAHEFVPHLSPLQLMLFALTYSRYKNAKEYPYAIVIKAMLDLEPNFTWQQYEHFHAHWETLIRLILCDGAEHTSTAWTIQQLYDAPKPPQILKCKKFVDNQTRFYLSKRSADICEWPSHFPPAYKSLSIPEGVTRKTIIPAANNPGFDIVGFENKRADGVESKPIVICTECRFSDPASTTMLDTATVEKTQDLTVDQFRPYFVNRRKLDGLTIKKENLFLVVCAFRGANANAITDLPQNTIVLNRDVLKKLYTPSLASRPQFILPLKKGEPTQVPE